VAVYGVFILRRDVLLHYVDMQCLLVCAVPVNVTLCNFTSDFDILRFILWGLG
jgi:hypothetical protein